MTAPQQPEQARLLFVHAHPDDETINSGVTMAAYAAAGARVVLVTCTRGEEGEVIPAELAHLAAGREDTLGEHRVRELAAAMTALGVREHVFLGAGDPVEPGFAPRTYADSGMAYAADGSVVPTPTSRAGAFASVDLDEVAARLAALVRRVRPHVVVTYEPGGGYGHPDHVQAHRVTMAAIERAASGDAGPGVGDPPWDVPKLYWCVVPRSQVEASFNRGALDAGQVLPSMVTADELVTTELDAPHLLTAKVAALQAHATQVSVKDSAFSLSNDVDQPLSATEWYRLARTSPLVDKAHPPVEGRESDLLAGVPGTGRLRVT